MQVYYYICIPNLTKRLAHACFSKIGIRKMKTQKRNQKIYTKKTIHRGMHVIECPKCKAILASASERMYLPEWSICDNEECDY